MICPATSFRLGSVIAECQGQDSAPRQLVGLAKRSHRTLREPPLTHEIVVIAQQFPPPKRDSADRFLAATAQVLDLTLVTADDSLLRLGTIRTMKN